jgi:hypothetical protein
LIVKGAYIVGRTLGKVAGKASVAHVHPGWITYKASGVAIKAVVVAVKVGLGILGGAAIGHTMMGE